MRFRNYWVLSQLFHSSTRSNTCIFTLTQVLYISCKHCEPSHRGTPQQYQMYLAQILLSSFDRRVPGHLFLSSAISNACNFISSHVLYISCKRCVPSDLLQPQQYRVLLAQVLRSSFNRRDPGHMFHSSTISNAKRFGSRFSPET